MATQAYTQNKESPLGKEIDLRQRDALVFKGGHVEKEQWWLVEDRNGQVGYAPVALLAVILRHDRRGRGKRRYREETRNSTEENQIGGWIGQEGEQRKSNSAAVICGIKRK